jgi:hypothetical protein
MNRERAETHLRLLAEAELRRAATWPADGGLLDECHSARDQRPRHRRAARR